MAQSAYTFHGDSKLWIENITKAQVRQKRSYLSRKRKTTEGENYKDLNETKRH